MATFLRYLRLWREVVLTGNPLARLATLSLSRRLSAVKRNEAKYLNHRGMNPADTVSTQDGTKGSRRAENILATVREFGSPGAVGWALPTTEFMVGDARRDRLLHRKAFLPKRYGGSRVALQ
jgi:hypothetical protein